MLDQALSSAMPSPKPTEERKRAGRILAEQIDAKWPGGGGTAEFARQVAKFDARKSAVGSAAQWKTGLGFGDRQRDLAAKVLGCDRAVFGYESSSVATSPAGASQERPPGLRRYLESLLEPERPSADEAEILRRIEQFARDDMPSSWRAMHHELARAMCRKADENRAKTAAASQGPAAKSRRS